MSKKNPEPVAPSKPAEDPPVTNVTSVHFAPVDAPVPPSESTGDEPTLRDGQPKAPPQAPVEATPQVPAQPVLDLSTFPYPFNTGEWHVLDRNVDPGLNPVAERAHALNRIDTPSVDVFSPHEFREVSAVVYTLKRATGIVILISGESLSKLNADVERMRDVKAAKERALQQQQAAGAALAESQQLGPKGS